MTNILWDAGHDSYGRINSAYFTHLKWNVWSAWTLLAWFSKEREREAVSAWNYFYSTNASYNEDELPPENASVTFTEVQQLWFLSSWCEVNPMSSSAWVDSQVRIRVHWSDMCKEAWQIHRYKLYGYGRLRMIVGVQNGWTKWGIHAQYKTLSNNYSWDVIPAPMVGHASASSELDPKTQTSWTMPLLFCRDRDQPPYCLVSLHALNSQKKIFHRINKAH